MMRSAILLLVVAIGATMLSGCREQTSSPLTVTGGDAKRGEVAFERIGCGSCHTAPGIRDAVGTVGPPLNDFGRRVFVAGQLPNTPENLVHWIEAPQSVAPGSAMPNLGVSARDARDIAAYLLSLR